MTNITVTIDGIHGIIKILTESFLFGRQSFEMRWCKFGEASPKTGFMTSFSDEPVIVTEVAAEQFVRMVVYSICNTITGHGEMSLMIYNHMSESLHDVQFMPPTFNGNEFEIIELVGKQDAIKKLFAIYDETGGLSVDFIDACAEEEVLEDMLSLIQIKASGFSIPIKPPETQFEDNN